MRNSRSDVIAAALRVLNNQGLEFCSMRRVAAELEVQPSALYHHVPNKQTLLALMADEIVRGVGEGIGHGSGRGVDHGEVAASIAARGDVLAGLGSGLASPGAGVASPGAAGCDPVGSGPIRSGLTDPTAAISDPAAAVDQARALCLGLRAAMLAVRDGADVVATASAFRLGASDVEARLSQLVGDTAARTLLLFTFGHTQSTQTQLQAAAVGALGHDPDEALDASFESGLELILVGILTLSAPAL